MLSEDEARAIIEPHLPSLLDCWTTTEDHFATLRACSPEAFSSLSNSTQAAIRYDLFVRELDRRFRGKPEAYVFKPFRSRVTHLTLSSKLTLRFKKFGKGKRCMYTKTLPALKYFERQEPVLPHTGEATTNSVFGYQLGRFGEFLGLYLTAPFANGNLWTLEIDCRDNDEGMGDTSDLQPNPVEPIAPKVRVKTDKEAQEERKQDEG